MFTGLIEGTGTLVRIDRHGPDLALVIRPNFMMEKIVIGESIAIDGACLTVVSWQSGVLSADVSAETLTRTTLGGKVTGTLLNLERAMRMGDRLGGHMVSGHIDAVGRLAARSEDGRSLRLHFDMPVEFSRYVIEKGSIAVNGVSLTVNGCGEGRFDVNVIPLTAQETTVGRLLVGDPVNLEMDLIGKYVEKMLKGWTSDRKNGSKVDADFLRKYGFL